MRQAFSHRNPGMIMEIIIKPSSRINLCLNRRKGKHTIQIEQKKLYFCIHMDENLLFFSLLRQAIGLERGFTQCPTPDEWTRMFQQAQIQALVGVLYQAVTHLPQEQKPPTQILLKWTALAEAVNGLNLLMNAESARLTTLFESQGHHTAILKGQANARLYPDPLSRQPGDIDIYVDGGKENVTDMLLRIGMLQSEPKLSDIGKRGKATTSYHHIHLPANKDGINVEVHFRPSSGNRNPFSNRHLQHFLEQEIRTTYMVPEGFRVPTVRFALIMQLSHIQRHFLACGIGLRQICDYLMLIQDSSADDRAATTALLRKCGLRNTAGALMWLMQQVFGLDENLMLCKPDARRGAWMLSEVMDGGSFGRYRKNAQTGLWRRFFYARMRQLRFMRFDFRELIWIELKYWKTILITIPERIRRRTWSFAEAQKIEMKKAL